MQAAIGKMQTALVNPASAVCARSHVQRRPQRASRMACRAQGGLNSPTSLIGCHSQVWVGGWDEKDIIKSVTGTKDAGFDLIEGIAAINSDQPCLPFDPQPLSARIDFLGRQCGSKSESASVCRLQPVDCASRSFALLYRWQPSTCCYLMQ